MIDSLIEINHIILLLFLPLLSVFFVIKFLYKQIILKIIYRINDIKYKKEQEILETERLLNKEKARILAEKEWEVSKLNPKNFINRF